MSANGPNDADNYVADVCPPDNLPEKIQAIAAHKVSGYFFS
jgi:hypothetical protein